MAQLKTKKAIANKKKLSHCDIEPLSINKERPEPI